VGRGVAGGGWTQDVRYARRSLCGVPAYSMTLVATLALGLGSVTGDAGDRGSRS